MVVPEMVTWPFESGVSGATHGLFMGTQATLRKGGHRQRAQRLTSTAARKRALAAGKRTGGGGGDDDDGAGDGDGEKRQPPRRRRREGRQRHRRRSDGDDGGDDDDRRGDGSDGDGSDGGDGERAQGDDDRDDDACPGPARLLGVLEVLAAPKLPRAASAAVGAGWRRVPLDKVVEEPQPRRGVRRDGRRVVRPCVGLLGLGTHVLDKAPFRAGVARACGGPRRGMCPGSSPGERSTSGGTARASGGGARERQPRRRRERVRRDCAGRERPLSCSCWTSRAVSSCGARRPWPRRRA